VSPGRTTQKLLKNLIDTGELSEAKFKEKELLEALKENGLVSIVPRAKAGKIIRLRDGKALLQYLKVQHDLELYAAWGDCIAASTLPEALKNALRTTEIAIPGKSSREVADRIQERLPLVREGMSRRTISTLLFWGDSKVLDGRPGIVDALGGSEPPVLLNVAGPEAAFSNILFIENYDTYVEYAASGFPDGTLLVYSAGFAASVRRMREETGCILHYAAFGDMDEVDRRRFEAWLWKQSEEQIPVAFFGDFDYAGMKIFRSLRRSFPQVTLYRPGYDAMLEAVRRGNGHTRKVSEKEKQTDPGTVGDAYADGVLLPAMRDCGFYDQEGVVIG
jgi:hypothetical protein